MFGVTIILNMKCDRSKTLSVEEYLQRITYTAYVSKHSSNRENKVILAMIPNEEGWHYLAVKNYKHY